MVGEEIFEARVGHGIHSYALQVGILGILDRSRNRLDLSHDGLHAEDERLAQLLLDDSEVTIAYFLTMVQLKEDAPTGLKDADLDEELW